MKRFVVQQDLVGGWDVHELGGEEVLHRSDRLRAEGHARRLASVTGGSVVVVAHTGMVISEYPVPAATRPPLRAETEAPRPGLRAW